MIILNSSRKFPPLPPFKILREQKSHRSFDNLRCNERRIKEKELHNFPFLPPPVVAPDAFRTARNREYCTEIKTVIITPPRTRSIFQSRMYPVLQRPTVVIDRPLLFQRPRITAYLSFRLGCPLLLACSANFKRADNILQETRSFSAPRPRVNRLPYDRGGEGGGSPSPDARRSSNKVDETDGSTVGDIYIYIYSRYVSSGLNAIIFFPREER